MWPCIDFAHMRGRLFSLIDFGRQPDSRGDVALGAGLVQPVIDGNEFTVRPLYSPRIANIRFARAASENIFLSPGRTVVSTEHRTDGARFAAVGVGDAEASIGEADHGGRIAAVFAVIFNGIRQPLPVEATVPRAEQLDEIVLCWVVVSAAQGHEEIAVGHANRRRHNRVAAGRFRSDPGELVPVTASGSGARTK